jgi:hypothetical protein
MMKTGKLNRKWCDLDMSQLDLAKLISHYAQSNKAEGKSPKTVAWYSEMLFGFVGFLRSTDGAAVLSQLDVTLAEAARELGLSLRTANSYCHRGILEGARFERGRWLIPCPIKRPLGCTKMNKTPVIS